MRYAMPCLLPFVLASSSGCSAPGPTDASGQSSAPLATGAAATLTFAADWTDSASQPLVAGQSVTIAYDAARLPQCRGDIGGAGPGWSVTAFYQVAGGTVGSVTVDGAGLSNVSPPATFVIPAAGDLALWFQVTSVWGCEAYDSSFGANYHFAVAPTADAPGWMGNVSSLIDRATCPGPCYADAVSADAGFTYDTWSRQQAAIAELFFDVWKQGVTDFDNPDLWKDLDVEMHSRVGGTAPFQTTYVSFAERTGNNARYAVDLKALDPLPGENGGAIVDKSQCPTFPTTVSANGQYIQADLQLYFTVNGAELRPADGTVFHGLVQNYLGLYAVCTGS